MPKFYLCLIAIFCSLAFATRAQNATNAPATEIENFELQTGAVIVKGYGQIGSLATSAGVISVRCKESANTITGLKEYGIAVGLTSNDARGFLVVDYDELDSLIRGVDFLGKITYDATTLPSFDATFTTKSGLRIVAHSERRQGGIQDFLQFADATRISLTSDQLSQFENLISQAKTSLDEMKNKNSSP
jgi:hypothetical protein